MEDLKVVAIKITAETHKRLKIAAAEDDLRIRELVEKLVLDFLEERKNG